MQESFGYLMHKDVRVAKVLFVNAHPVEVQEIYNQEHMPVGVDNAESLVMWLEGRNMPFDRPFANEVLRSYGVYSGSDFAGLSHNESLTDTYWFADEGEVDEGFSWKDLNPWVREWSQSGEALFVGRTDLVTDLDSPDFATGGFLPKVWVKQPDNIFLLKRDGRDGMNVFSEIIASEIADALNISHVPYFYSVTLGEVCSGCPCMITSDMEELVSGSQLASNMRELKDYFSSINCSGEFYRMRVLDYIIGNKARSLNDVAVVRDPDSLAVYGAASLFDHGEAFQELEEDDKRFMMSLAKEGIRYMTGAKLDSDSILQKMEDLSKELVLDENIVKKAEEDFENRAKIYNQMVEAF